jgi:PII-like signaling protein
VRRSSCHCLDSQLNIIVTITPATITIIHNWPPPPHSTSQHCHIDNYSQPLLTDPSPSSPPPTTTTTTTTTITTSRRYGFVRGPDAHATAVAIVDYIQTNPSCPAAQAAAAAVSAAYHTSATATGITTSSNILSTTATTVARAIIEYCRAHPRSDIADAALAWPIASAAISADVMTDIDSTTSAATELTQEGGGELPSTVHLVDEHATVTAAEPTQASSELPSTVHLVDEHATVTAAEPTQASSELPSTVYLVDEHATVTAAEPTQASSELPSTVHLVDEHATVTAAELTQASSELPSTVYLVDDHEAIAAAEPTQASSDLPSPTNRFADGILGNLPIPSPSAVQQ